MPPTNNTEHRRNTARLCDILGFALILAIGTSLPAYAAYVDPGSGMLLLQVIAASCAGMVFAFRGALLNAVGFLFRRRKDDADQETS